MKERRSLSETQPRPVFFFFFIGKYSSGLGRNGSVENVREMLAVGWNHDATVSATVGAQTGANNRPSADQRGVTRLGGFN